MVGRMRSGLPPFPHCSFHCSCRWALWLAYTKQPAHSSIACGLLTSFRTLSCHEIPPSPSFPSTGFPNGKAVRNCQRVGVVNRGQILPSQKSFRLPPSLPTPCPGPMAWDTYGLGSGAFEGLSARGPFVLQSPLGPLPLPCPAGPPGPPRIPHTWQNGGTSLHCFVCF